jgi:hypothetical protein
MNQSVLSLQSVHHLNLLLGLAGEPPSSCSFDEPTALSKKNSCQSRKGKQKLCQLTLGQSSWDWKSPRRCEAQDREQRMAGAALIYSPVLLLPIFTFSFLSKERALLITYIHEQPAA